MAPGKVAGRIRGTADELWGGSNIIWRAGMGNERKENPLEQEGLQGEHGEGSDLQALLSALAGGALLHSCSNSSAQTPVSHPSIFSSLHKHCQKGRCSSRAANTNAQGPALHPLR